LRGIKMSNKNGGYKPYEEVTKKALDFMRVGDLVLINDWKKPMRIKGVSENYAVGVQTIFGKIYYSVIEKKQRREGNHNEMRNGCFHCGPDHWIFGAGFFDYNFDDAKGVNGYLKSFERGNSKISERHGIAIFRIKIKLRSGRDDG